jgi:hypothetical protein
MTQVSGKGPALSHRIGYFGLLLIGVGTMLLAVRAGTTDDRLATLTGAGFAAIGLLLLFVAGAFELGRMIRGNRSLDVREQQSNAPKQDELRSSPTTTEELTDSERAFIKLLRTSDVPPDAVVKAIQEVLESKPQK